MKTTVRFFFYLVVGVMAFACTQDSDVPSIDGMIQGDNDFIKAITSNGVIVNKYYYDEAGRIVETNGRFYFYKYIYDGNGRIEKIESAMSSAIYSSLAYDIEAITDLMTSQNTSATNYALYTYDHSGRVSEISNYAKPLNDPDGKFEHRSTRYFEYEGSLIVKSYMNDPSTGQANLIYAYTYDSRGNVINEKYYSSMESKNKLSSENSYKYDDYKNPFQVMSPHYFPGIYTNPNNIVEIKFTSYEDIPESLNNTTLKQSYEYNSNGYPVKLIQDGKTVEEYVY